MRILMACAAFPPFIDGGGPISAMIVAKLLLRLGHDVTVVNVADEARDEIHDGVPVRRLTTLNVDWNYRLPRPAWKKLAWHALENFNPRAFFAMRRQIRELKPDLVLTDSIENINVATWAAAKSRGVPVAHIVRSAFLVCWKGSMWKGDRNCEGACASCQASSFGKKLSSRFVDAVIGETDFILDRHFAENYFPQATRHRIAGAVTQQPGVSPRPAPPATQPLRIGYIGVHDRLKGLDTLADAARRLIDRPVEFLIAGTGSRDYAKTLPERFPAANTRFLGWTRPEDFFPQVDVIVVPSLIREPFGRVIIEAFAQGVPVIGARSGGIPETIEPGVSGLLFEPGDDAGLAARIETLLGDREQVARLSAGALLAASRYAPERIAAAYDEVLTGLVASAALPQPQGLEAGGLRTQGSRS